MSQLWERKDQSLELISFPLHSAPLGKALQHAASLAINILLLPSGTETFLPATV